MFSNYSNLRFSGEPYLSNAGPAPPSLRTKSMGAKLKQQRNSSNHSITKHRSQSLGAGTYASKSRSRLASNSTGNTAIPRKKSTPKKKSKNHPTNNKRFVVEIPGDAVVNQLESSESSSTTAGSFLDVNANTEPFDEEISKDIALAVAMIVAEHEMLKQKYPDKYSLTLTVPKEKEKKAGAVKGKKSKGSTESPSGLVPPTPPTAGENAEVKSRKGKNSEDQQSDQKKETETSKKKDSVAANEETSGHHENMSVEQPSSARSPPTKPEDVRDSNPAESSSKPSSALSKKASVSKTSVVAKSSAVTVQPQSETDSRPRTKGKRDSESKTKLKVKKDSSESKTKLEVKRDSESKTKLQIKRESESKTKLQIRQESESKIKLQVKRDSESKTKLQVKRDSESKTKLQVRKESESKTKLQMRKESLVNAARTTPGASATTAFPPTTASAGTLSTTGSSFTVSLPPVPTIGAKMGGQLEVLKYLDRIQNYMNHLGYHRIGEPVIKINTRLSTKMQMVTAREIIQCSAPIKCLHAVVLSVHFTNCLDTVERFPIYFRSHVSAKEYKHIVLGIYVQGHFGALGISRDGGLQDKPASYTKLSDLIFEYAKCYGHSGHILNEVKFGNIITHDQHSLERLFSKNYVVPIAGSLHSDIEKNVEKFAKQLRSKMGLPCLKSLPSAAQPPSSAVQSRFSRSKTSLHSSSAPSSTNLRTRALSMGPLNTNRPGGKNEETNKKSSSKTSLVRSKPAKLAKKK